MKEMEKTSQKSKRGQDRAKPDQLSCCYSYLAVAIPAPAAGVNQAWAGGSHWALRFLFCSGLSEYLFLELEATHSLSTIRRSFGLYLYRQIYPEPSPFLSLWVSAASSNKKSWRDFPGGPGVKTLCFHCREDRSPVPHQEKKKG